MPPFEVGPARAISAIDSRLARETRGQGHGPVHARQTLDTKTLVETENLDAGQPPIDIERISEIRKAVETGTYPIIPAKIADAMIAAGHILRSAK